MQTSFDCQVITQVNDAATAVAADAAAVSRHEITLLLRLSCNSHKSDQRPAISAYRILGDAGEELGKKDRTQRRRREREKERRQGLHA